MRRGMGRGGRWRGYMRSGCNLPIIVGQEADGRWWADIELMPGVMAYGDTREAAIDAVCALALRVAADCLEHGEDVPEPLARVFSLA